MENCSLKNWLENSGLSEENVEIITKMHFDAPGWLKSDYKIVFRDGDCFMDWKFSITYGRR
jgi:hypothetical protein